MTAIDLMQALQAAHPKAADFAESELRGVDTDAVAKNAGYRVAGIRLGRVVFTTKDVA